LTKYNNDSLGASCILFDNKFTDHVIVSNSRLCFLVVFIISLLFSVLLHAQIKTKIEHYSAADGLSHDGVTTMLKDREGFMWFGTWDGINRFDGTNFVSYKTRPGDRSALKSNRIDNIVEDHDGYLWLGAYDNQIYRFDKRNGSFLAIADILEKHNLRDVLFSNIIPGRKGEVWLTTFNQGIFQILNSKSGVPLIKRYAAGLKGDSGLPSNHVNFFHIDKGQNIWIGTDKGISGFSAAGDGLYNKIILPAGYNNISYTCIAESNKTLWFGTGTGEVISYEKSLRQISRHKISAHRLNAVLVSRDQHQLYCSAKAELITLNLDHMRSSMSLAPGDQVLLSLYEDRSGKLWIEPAELGIIMYNPKTRTFRNFYQHVDENFHNKAKEFKVFEDHTSRVWMSMKNGGFGYYNPNIGQIEYFYNHPGSSDRQFSNMIICSYFDPAGVLWLSTHDRGIDKILFQRNDFQHKLLVDNSMNKSDNEVRGIYSDHEGRLWITSKANRTYLYDRGKKIDHIFINEPDGGIGPVYTILQDKKGIIWLGTKGNGLYKAEKVNGQSNKYKLSHYMHNPDDSKTLSNDIVYAILEDKKGRIWIGTYENGLNLVVGEGKDLHFANAANAFKNYPKGQWNRIRHLQQDVKGNIWIATTHGLVIFDPEKGPDRPFRRYGKIPGDPASLGNNDVQYICRDSKNRIWVATSGGGLNRVLSLSDKGLKFEVLTKENGLPSDYILGVVEDNSGDLWLATENGISRYNPEHSSFQNYDAYDGLPKTGFSEGSCLKLPNGDLMFGCIIGYLRFAPGRITNHKINASMAFTRMQVNNKDAYPEDDTSYTNIDVNETNEVVLSYNENTISVDFTVLDYRSGNKQSYAYQLKGFDDNWYKLKNKHSATYTNIPPGDYLFKVKSLSTDLYLNMPQKSLRIRINPPLWRTAVAYLVYAILITAFLEMIRRIAFAMIRLRNRIAVEQKLTELKLSFFTNISHELRTPLTLIVNPIEEIYLQENLSERGREYISVVRRNANRMVRFINQLLDFRKAQSGKMRVRIERMELIAFVKDIAACYDEIAKEKNIQLQIISNVNELFVWIDAEKIDIVIYNLLSNAFKFSGNQTTVSLNVDHDPGQEIFTITVTDQGIGVPQDKLGKIFELYYEVDKKADSTLEGTGIGLALCKEIITAHHGHIEAANHPLQGLIVTVQLKMGNDHYNEADIFLPDTGPIFPDHARQLKVRPSRLSELTFEREHSIVPDQEEKPLVLITDDNAELRKFLAAQLKEFYRVMEASDGEEGLAMAFSVHPDLILSDVMMPKMDGIQMLDRLKNNMVTSHIPVILLTARSSIENQLEGLAYGADYYITKPFPTEFIVAAVSSLLKQRKRIFESLLTHKRTIELHPSEILITSKDETFLKRVISIVEQGMNDPEYNIDSVAESIAMGRTTFYKKLKSLTGLAPVEFVRDMRLKRARQLLEAGENNVSEIAYAVGFNSSRYFSTCFKEAYGVSPSAYAKNESAKTA